MAFGADLFCIKRLNIIEWSKKQIELKYYKSALAIILVRIKSLQTEDSELLDKR